MTTQRRLRILSFGANAMGVDKAVRVAFASTDMRHVDQHFGAAEGFAIYTVDPERHAMAELIQFGEVSMDGNEDKLAAKIAALTGCAAVYCQAVGASAVKQLCAAGIQPVKVAAGTPVTELVATLQQELRTGRSAWLSRAVEGRESRDGGRFDVMEAEGWSE